MWFINMYNFEVPQTRATATFRSPKWLWPESRGCGVSECACGICSGHGRLGNNVLSNASKAWGTQEVGHVYKTNAKMRVVFSSNCLNVMYRHILYKRSGDIEFENVAVANVMCVSEIQQII